MDRSTRNRRQFIELLGAGVAVPLVAAEHPAEAAAAHANTPASSDLPGVYEVTRFGAVGDGRTSSTEALQKAIDACGAAGGGTVYVPPGQYLSGALFLRSHVHLYLSPGATLVASTRPEDFPPIKGRDEGLERNVHASLLTGIDLTNVSITGHGRIDGQGEPWWHADDVTRKMRVEAKLPREAEHPAGAPLKWPRPRTINLIRCHDVLVEGITIKDSPCWNIHLVYCEDVVIERFTAFQQHDARGTDCVVVDSTKRVRVANCSFSSGGDCVAIKSGYNEDGRRVGIPSEDVLVTDCHMYHTAASGVAIGSEAAAGVRNVMVSNCVIHECLSGVYIRSPRGRGGVVEKVRVTNLVIDHADEQAIKLSHFFDSVKLEGRYGYKNGPGRSNLETARSRKAPVDIGTPTFRDFAFSGLTLGKVREMALVEGLPERFIRGIVFENITASHAAGGLSCTMTAEVSISNITVNTLEAPAVDARDVERLEIHRVRCGRPTSAVPFVWLENVAGGFVYGCDVGEAGPAFEWLHQEQTRDVAIAANKVPTPAPAAPKKAG
jgi:hypothetical protein